jgi:hypothetical protein
LFSQGALGGSGGSGGAGGPGGGASGSSSFGAAAGNGGSSAQITRFHTSRAWLATKGPKERRRTTFVYRLVKAGKVVFTIRQVSPACALVGSFVVRAHKGMNKTPFRGRVHGRPLGPGTYEVTVRTPNGSTLLRTTFVVVDSGVPSPAAIAAARQENVCAARAALASIFTASVLAASGSESASGGGSTQTEIVRNQRSELLASGEPHNGPGLGAFSSDKLARAVSNPLVIAALAAAIALLGLAALPRTAVSDPRLNDLLVRHRAEVAMAGAGAFLAAIAALLLA